MATYREREFEPPTIDMNALGAIITGAQVAVLHGDGTPGEKVAGIKAIAELARDVAAYWESQAAERGLRPGSTRLWNRLAGLSREGSPDMLLARVAEQVADAERESEQSGSEGGGLDA